jgi:hypothetical protein
MTYIRDWLTYGVIAAALLSACDPIPATPHPSRQHVHNVPPA